MHVVPLPQRPLLLLHDEHALAREDEESLLPGLRVVEPVRLARPEHRDVDGDVAEGRVATLDHEARPAFLLVAHSKRIAEVEHEPAFRSDVEPVRRVVDAGLVRHVYSNPVRAESFASDCCATTRRTVPERERMTIESVTRSSGRVPARPGGASPS